MVRTSSRFRYILQCIIYLAVGPMMLTHHYKFVTEHWPQSSAVLVTLLISGGIVAMMTILHRMPDKDTR